MTARSSRRSAHEQSFDTGQGILDNRRVRLGRPRLLTQRRDKKNEGNVHFSYSLILDDAMDETLEARYAEILATTHPSFLDPAVAKTRGLSTPFLVNGPKDPSARRIMVIGREFGGKHWHINPEGGGVNAYVEKALAKHRASLDKWLDKGGDGGTTFFNFMRALADRFDPGGLIYSNLFCMMLVGVTRAARNTFPRSSAFRNSYWMYSSITSSQTSLSSLTGQRRRPLGANSSRPRESEVFALGAEIGRTWGFPTCSSGSSSCTESFCATGFNTLQTGEGGRRLKRRGLVDTYWTS